MLDQHTAQPLSSRHRLCAAFVFPSQAEVMPHGETQKPTYQAHVSDGGTGSSDPPPTRPVVVVVQPPGCV